jgi:Cu+-exporting ATPase
VPASLVRKNEEIIVEPMSIIPCDCYVLEGRTVVDESTMTGESFPTTKVVGDFLLSGTKNLSSRVVAVVSAEQQDSSLERLIESISSALEQKSDDHGRLDTAMGYFVSAILVIAAVSFAASFLNNNGLLLDRINIAAQRAMAVLAASCPCALGLATPSATMAAVDAAWTKGALLIGGKKTLTALSSVTHIVMDKTGTLTEGHLQVTYCHLNNPAVDRVLCQRLLYLTEREVAQSHPAAKAVFQWALQQLESTSKHLQTDSKVKDHEIVLGKGVSCIVTDPDGTSNSIHIGSARFLQAAGISWAQSKHSVQNQNHIEIHFAVNNNYTGYLLLQVSVASCNGKLYARLIYY